MYLLSKKIQMNFKKTGFKVIINLKIALVCMKREGALKLFLYNVENCIRTE